jgi:hypothetical protein
VHVVASFSFVAMTILIFLLGLDELKVVQVLLGLVFFWFGNHLEVTTYLMCCTHQSLGNHNNLGSDLNFLKIIGLLREFSTFYV